MRHLIWVWIWWVTVMPMVAAEEYTDIIVHVPTEQLTYQLRKAQQPILGLCTATQTPEECLRVIADAAYFFVSKGEHRHLSDVGASLSLSTEAQTRRLLALQSELEGLRQQMEAFTAQLQMHDQTNEALRETLRSEVLTEIHQTQARVERLEQR